MNKIVKNTLILTAITVVSGLLLGVVYDITKEPSLRHRKIQTGGIQGSSLRCFFIRSC